MPKAKMLKYHKYEDPAHGWLKVSMKTIRQLNLKDQISRYSFVSGSFVFLEEDRDMPLFIQAWENQVGCQFPPIERHTADEKSWIRQYPAYN